MKDIIKSLDIIDWCMVALIITLVGLACWWTYLYENTGILSGVGLGVAIGALTMGLGVSARDHKEAAECKGQV